MKAVYSVTNISKFVNDIRGSINAFGYNHVFSAEDSESRHTKMGMGGYQKISNSINTGLKCV